MHIIDAPARSIVVASILSQVAGYMLQQPNKAGQKPPWDHNSEYAVICTQLNRLETMFELFQPIQANINVARDPSGDFDDHAIRTDTFLFSYVIYQLCYCLMYHPFLLRRVVDGSTKRTPLSFLSHALSSCRTHAQELVNTLTNARQAGFKLGASFYGYCLLVAGTVHALFQNSTDELIRAESSHTVDYTLALLAEKAKIWTNSACMVSN
jgi:hypothetical protein